MSTRQFLRKNILQLFLLPENSSYTEEEGMLDLPIKKTGTGYLFGIMFWPWLHYSVSASYLTKILKDLCISTLPDHFTLMSIKKYL